MSSTEIVLTEKCGTLGRLMVYHKNPASNKVTRLSGSDTLAKSLFDRAKDLFREIFLPHGYPDSVSEDYLEYQVWDTLQAFCSTITGTFTTQAILKSVGVGDAKATPFAAAFTWIMKDGTGMIGRIFFAWWKGNSLDADCKKWRLCADILNDTAMFLELLVPFIGRFSLQILCITTSMKAVVGVAGSATRASITQHQAIQGNMADVSAKDGSQETCVNLIASFVGIVLLAVVTDWRYEWALFFLFMVVHLVANYFAVCSLNIPHLNTARLNQVLSTYFRFDTVPNPISVNKSESVVIGFGENISDICGFKIKMGKSLNQLPSTLTLFELTNLIQVYKDSRYLIVPDVKNRVMYVALEKGESVHDVIAAYFHAVLLGIATCYYNHVNVNVYTKRQLRHVTPIVRLFTALKPYQKTVAVREELLLLNALKTFSDVVKQETVMFFTALNVNGWNLNTHSIETGEWRAQWKSVLDVSPRDYSVPGHNKME
ncbi:hypothetical protein RN001_011822 [Aquatica leii]|uniref:RUS family member 1 n=1 Tax=Aquatica leii TaxID=1421715 RepID=A0AAN7SP90_9COLE|nr:hypothetical protein RN001_011822 [Aquatica leii]